MFTNLRKQFTVIFFLLCSFQYAAFAQDILQKPDPLPPTPETAAFGKNIAIPVSYSSGTPQIGIPLYSVKSGSMELPVSLSYNASGIRVEETSTWVGLGWSLNAGGMISRTVRGKPDETPDWGYMNQGPLSIWRAKYMDTAHCRCMEATGLTWYYENYLQAGFPDMEPDVFNFSVLGYSGEFSWNQDSAKFILSPFQNIHIAGVPGTFILTLPNGVRATFSCTECEEATENSISESYVDGMAQAPSYGGFESNSWSLSELMQPTGEKIELFYAVERGLNFSRGGERFGSSMYDASEIMRRQTYTRQYYKKPVLTRISGELADIYFKRSSAVRQDMVNYLDGQRSLDTIIVKNKQGQEIKSFYLRHGYFQSPAYSITSLLGISGYGEEARKRLYLQSVVEKKGTDSLPPYEFGYNNLELPSRLSTSQDYWGYFNGKSNGTLIMPRIPNLPFYPWQPDFNELTQNLPAYGSYLTYGGADRRIDSNYNQARLLNKIKYPTGGQTEYSYESNSAATSLLTVYGGIEPPDMVEKAYTFSILSNPVPQDPPYPLSFTGTFSIAIPATKVKIIPNLPTCTTYADASCKISVQVKSLPGMTVVASFNTTNAFDVQLAQGTYQVEVTVSNSAYDTPLPFSISFLWGERLDPESFLVGGVRVKKIVSSDGLGGKISRSFKYSMPLGTQSSGIVEGCPVYAIHDVLPSGTPVRRYYASNSTQPLTQDGKTVLYQFVTEYSDSAKSSFKTEYNFTAGIFNRDKFAGAKTGAPSLRRGWQAGLLERKQVYERTGASTYRVLSDEQSFFQSYNNIQYLAGLYGAQIIPYETASEWYMPDSSVSISYAYPNNVQVASQTTSKQFYNNRLLPAKTRSVNSKKQVQISNTWYASDYNDVSGFSIPSLAGNHIIEAPIRRENSVNGKIVAGSVIKYNGLGQALEAYTYQNASLADTVAHNPNTILTSNHKFVRRLYYTSNGAISQIEEKGNEISAVLWNLGGTYPVAQVNNADTSSIAYSSFETDATAKWSLGSGTVSDATAVTGKYAYGLTAGSISRSGLASNTYIVSYWKKDASGGSVSVNGTSSITGPTGNGWTYYQHKVVNPSSGIITVSGSAIIDELRLYPEKSMMTSFTIEPLIGMTSQCSGTNQVMRYEYDALNRLSLIRDVNDNILKKNCYNYFGQPSDCAVGSGAYWQAITNTCDPGTGNLLVTEKDMNPASGTYGTTRVVTLTGACTVSATCSPANCIGNNKKCINNICETGVKVITGSTRLTSTTWRCYFHYLWSDDSISITYDEVQTGACPMPF